MAERNLNMGGVDRKLTYGSESDRPSKTPEIDINGKTVLITHTKTSNVGKLMHNRSISQSTNDNDPLLLRNDDERQRQEPRVGKFTLQQPDKLTLGNKIMRGVLGFFGGLIGGAVGAAAGLVGGSIIGTPITGIGMAVVAGGVGAASGAYSGVALADSISRLFDNAPQDKHLDMAMRSLQSSRGPFSPSEADNLKNVSPREWRNLLPVHRKKPWFGNDKRVGNRADRQKIREAVVLFIAKHGKAEAADYKHRLIAAANSRTPNALQSEINKLKAQDVGRELDAVDNMNARNRDAMATEFGNVVRRNPDVFLAPSAVQGTMPFKMNAPNIGMEAALGVVGRMERTGRITEQDRQEFNRAMNILGLPDRQAHADPRATKDVLGPYVGRYLNHESKHKIAQALYKQFGIYDQGYSLNLYTKPRRILQSTLDPAQFKKDLDNKKMAMATYGRYADRPSYDTAEPGQRDIIANAELAALREAAMTSLTADGMVQQITQQIRGSLNDAANRFETPSEQRSRLQQQRVYKANVDDANSENSVKIDLNDYWDKNGIPDQLALDKPIDVQGQATNRFAIDVQTIANKNFGNYMPEPRDNNKPVLLSKADKPGDLTRPEQFDDGVHKQFLADIERDIAVTIDSKKIPNDQNGAKDALQTMDEESRKALTAFLHQGMPQAINKALGDPKERSPDAFLPGIPTDAYHNDNHVVFDVTTNDDGSFDVKVDYKKHMATILPTDSKAAFTQYDPDESVVAYQFNVKIDPKARDPLRITSPINYQIKTKLQK